MSKVTKQPESSSPKHPVQPLEKDIDGVLRYKRNAAVRFLLNEFLPGLNKLNEMCSNGNISREDYDQLMQLIGYSHDGCTMLPDDIYNVAEIMYKTGLSEKDARITYLETELKQLKDTIREPMARLFGVHPNDLKGE